MVKPVEIAGRLIGPGHPCFVIAEAGVNHNGDLELARRLIDVAVDAGADAVKFQSFRAEEVVSPQAPKAEYQKQTTDAAESQLEMLRRLELSAEAHRELQTYCQQRGILFLSTPFDYASADLLDTLDVPAFKIPSGEITNKPFLQYLAGKGRPLILSTGMSTLGEVDEAMRWIAESGDPPVVLLHCVSSYPTPAEEVNLRAMQTLRAAFQVPVGYSDHTTGIEIPLAAAALGANVIEKHFTLDRSLPGPDHKASLEPDELKAMITGIRRIEAAVGDGRKIPAVCEANTAQVARRSLIAAQDIPAGTPLTREMIAIKRPGTGIPPARLAYILGRRARTHIPAGTVLSLEMFA